MKAIHKMGKVVPLRGDTPISERRFMETLADLDNLDTDLIAALCQNTEWSLQTVVDTVEAQDCTKVSVQELYSYLGDCLEDIKDDSVGSHFRKALPLEGFAEYLYTEGFYVYDDISCELWEIG